MENINLYLIIVALTLISLGLVGWIIYLKYKSKYTREKYAFASLLTTTSLATLGVSSVLYQPPWAAILAVFSYVTKAPIPELDKPVWSEQVLVILFILCVIWMIQLTFHRWDNEISVNQHEQQKRHDPVFYVAEGWQELVRKLKKEELPIYIPIDYSKQFATLDIPSDLVWRIQAIELLTLRWHGYYRFETENDENWHEKENCWLGKNVKENKTTAVLCCRTEPTDNEIQTFVNYVERLEKNSPSSCEFIIITQEGESERKSKLINDAIEIQQYSESWLLDDLVNFEDYFLDLKRRVEFDCLPDSELKLADIYVPSAIREENQREDFENLEDYLNKWLIEQGRQQLALLGEYGQGKSTGTLMFSHHLIQNNNNRPPRIPILLELRGKSPKTLQPLELLSVWASNYRIDSKALMKLQQAGRLLLIFEGFDEMAEVSDSEARFNHFRSLWRFSYPKSKILITGRPNFFLDDNELKALLGIENGTSTGGACVKALHLQPFSKEQITNSLRNTNPENRNEIIQLAIEDSKFYDIVSRPSLLYIVSQLWDKAELKERKNNMSSAFVIGLFIQHSYKRQTDKIRDGKQFMVLTEAEREYFMDGIAAFMATKNLPNQISLSDFNQIIEELYDVIPNDLKSNPLNGDSGKPLKLRLKDNDDALETVKTDVRTCGVLVKDLTRSNTFKFPHKSFLEYLFANYAVKRLMNKNDASAAAIWKVTKAEPEDLLNMTESLEFAGELLRYTNDEKLTLLNKREFQKELLNMIFGKHFVSNNIKLKMSVFVHRSVLLTEGSRTFVSAMLVVTLLSLCVSVFFTITSKEAMQLEIKSPLDSVIVLISMVFSSLVLNSIENPKKANLWFLLIVISGVEYKDIKTIYGKRTLRYLHVNSMRGSDRHILDKYVSEFSL